MTPPRPPTVRAVRRGHAPNCSATGTVVGLVLTSATAAAVLVNAYAHRFARWLDPEPPTPDGPGGPAPTAPPAPEEDGSASTVGAPSPHAPHGDALPASDPPEASAPPVVRRETFGGLVALADPPAVLAVDGDTLDRALAAGARPVGSGKPVPGALTAPVEAHVALTDRCPTRCEACYLDAGPDGLPADTGTLRDDLDGLARLGTLEIAVGGGEVLLDPRLLEVVRHIRSLGMVPNLTTSGLGLTPALARALASEVGQVNVSWDGPGAVAQAVRGWRADPPARRALGLLTEAGVRTGVNTVLTRHNVDALPAFADTLASMGVDEWQWLRLKPTGRGREAYDALTLDDDQHRRLWPLLLQLEETHGLTLRIDCALVPFLVDHRPPLEALQRLGVAGCPGGQSLWSRGADGRRSPCSFAHELPHDPRERSVADAWARDGVLRAWRRRAARPPEPCASCTYRSVCRGGCRIVAHHVTGDALAPDPDCPRVRRARAGGAAA